MVPWLAGIAQTSPRPAFTQDVAVLRTLGLLPVGLEGLVSAALGNVFALLPLGPRGERAAWASALALGVASSLVFSLVLRWLRARQGSRGLDALLALIAALTTALGPSWLLEGTTTGGAAVAAALALLCVALKLDLFALGARRDLALGAALGLTFIESRWTGLAVVVAMLVPAALTFQPPSARQLAAFAGGFAVVMLLPLALAAALFFAGSADAELALGLMGHGWTYQSVPVDRSAALGSWLAEVGLLWCVLAIFGLAYGILAPRSRRLVAPLFAFLLFDLTFGVDQLDSTRPDPLSAVRLLALAGLAASGALGARALVDLAGRARLAFAPAISTLLVVYGFTLVFVSAEDSAAAAQERQANAAEAWTDAALESLPPSSALLVRSEATLFRFLAARATSGSRPDVLMVPLDLLARGGVRSQLLARENGLLPLLREVLLSGRPSEYSLSALADARPAYVELDPEWDARLRVHLVPQPFFIEFAAHPLARS
ncbi:MAG TPA: hypothetical protein VER33_00520, partial [Polyangiaceae bacterium]|nr:hypothetical protein [Polyangiaceae bacterium]